MHIACWTLPVTQAELVVIVMNSRHLARCQGASAVGEQVELLTHCGSTLTKASPPTRHCSWGLHAETERKQLHRFICPEHSSWKPGSRVKVRGTDDSGGTTNRSAAKGHRCGWYRLSFPALCRQPQTSAASRKGRRAALPYAPGWNLQWSRKSGACVWFHLNNYRLDTTNPFVIHLKLPWAERSHNCLSNK